MLPFVSPRTPSRQRRPLRNSGLLHSAFVLLLAACAGAADVTGAGSGNGNGGGTPQSGVPSRIDISTNVIGLGAIGASENVAVIVRNATGAVLNNAAVTWTSADITIADVSGNGPNATITARAPGRTTIRAASGSASQEIVVNVNVVRSMTLPASTTVRAGGSITLTPTFDADAGASTQLRWETADATIASVANGVITGVRPGETTIRAIAVGDPRVTATAQVTVTAARSVSIRNVPERVFQGDEVQLAAALDVDDGESQALEWSTSAPAVATITSGGKLIAVGTGNVVVRVRSAAFDAVRDSVAVRVRQPWVVAVTPSSLALAPGETQQLQSTVQLDEGMSNAVTWRSSDASVAMVATNGMVTAIAPGSARITAVSVADTTVRADASVSVVAEVRSVEVQPQSVSLIMGGTRQFTASVTGDRGVNTEVLWRSANPSVALVSASGLVTAVSTGSTVITAISRADTTKRASGTVSITTGVRDVDVQPSAVTIGVRENRQLSATVGAETGADTRLQWRTSNSAIATVSDAGIVTGVSPGAAFITAVSLADTTLRSSSVVTVRSIPVVTVNPTTLNLEPGQQFTIGASVQADVGVSTAVTWRTSNAAVATVSSAGQVNALSNGSTTITAVSVADTTRRASATVTVQTVPRVQSVSVSPTNSQVVIGSGIQLTPSVLATGGASTAVTFRSDNPAVASVNFSGLVTALTTGSATITVTSSADATKSATALITVIAQPATQLATSWSSSRLGGALVEDVVSIDAASTSAAFAVNSQGDVFQFNGSSWTAGARGSSFGTRFLAVSASSSNNAIAVGTNGVIVRFNGSSWSSTTSGTQVTLNGVHVESSSTAFAVGSNGVILRFNGSSWSSMPSGSSQTLNGVWTSGSNGFAVGTNGEIVRWNGSSWARMNSGVTETLNGVNAISSTDAIAVGAIGTVLRWNGSTWVRVNTGSVGSDMYNVAGSTANSNRYYITTDNGLYSLNNTTLAAVSTPYAPRLFGVAIDGTGNVWTSGQRGSVMRLGSVWETVSLAPDLIDVWTTSPTNAWAVGEFGFVYRWNGSGWSRQSTPTTGTLNTVWGASASEAFAAGDNGVMLRFNGSSWSTMSFPSTGNIYGIWGSAANNVYAVTSNGEVMRFNGSIWSLAFTASNPLWAVFGTSASDVYVSGENGVALRFNGTTWSAANVATSGTLAGIWASSSTNLLAVGSASGSTTGISFRNTGAGWTSVGMPASNMLTSVWGAFANDVYVTGDAGLILRWNGSTWSTMSSGTSDLLWSVSGSPTGAGGAFAVGYNSTVASGVSSGGIMMAGFRANASTAAMNLDPRANARVVRGALPSGKARRNRKH